MSLHAIKFIHNTFYSKFSLDRMSHYGNQRKHRFLDSMIILAKYRHARRYKVVHEKF